MGTTLLPTLRVDPELARVAVGLHCASPFRLWVVGRSITRQGNGSGKIAKTELKAVLEGLGVRYTRQHLNAILRAGEGLFWNTDRLFLYLRSSQFVAQQLTQKAIDENPDLLSNKAGVTEVLLSPTGTLEQWQATIYAGWIAHRDNPTISRDQLEKLFNRSADTLRRWEEVRLQKIVSTRTNYAQCDKVQTWDKIRPAYARTYVARTKDGLKTRLIWQLPNTYKVKGIKTHAHRGQSLKVRKAVNKQLQQPANKWRGGLPVAKLYFDSTKRLQSHLKKHAGAVYLWRGKNRHKHGIYEATATGWSETTATERVSFSLERDLSGYEGIPMQL